MGITTTRERLALAIGILGYTLFVIFAFITPFMHEYLGWAVFSGLVGMAGTGVFFTSGEAMSDTTPKVRKEEE